MSGVFKFLRHSSGSSAVEFALVLPGLLILTIGTFYLFFTMYAAMTLHFAVEDAARCASVKTAICTNATTTQTYAASKYSGPGMGVSFAATTPSCGNQVVGTGTILLRTGIAAFSVPISATACYPA
jgi:Flp pilus assembly protein TadG